MNIIKLPTGTFEYDQDKPLGKRGGFGQVFAGKAANGEYVAVKKLHVSAADAAHRELRIADELKGRSFEYVIPFIDAGEDADSGNYFVVMPKAEQSLQSAIEKAGKFDASVVANILLQVANGLVEVGTLVHRDLKPDNILFHEGKWKIADFGIARFVEEVTASNTLKDCLSPYYAAPEQWRFERATHVTDIYALGCIGFCLLTGGPPFTLNPSVEHQNAPLPPLPSANSRLHGVIQLMLRKLPETRPQLSRVSALLAEIVKAPVQTSDLQALSALATAGAHIAEQEQQEQAKRQAHEMARKARRQLASHAFEVLSENVERLWGKIHSQAPSAQRASGNRFECKLGGSALTVDLTGNHFFEPGKFSQSGWDVVASSAVFVNQMQPKYVWASSLWYVKLKGVQEYRWHEVSYWTLSHAEYQPFVCLDLRDADLAASNVMHSVNIAFGPHPVDDEEEDEFHARWIWLLAQASIGQLRHPSRLPINSWPPL